MVNHNPVTSLAKQVVSHPMTSAQFKTFRLVFGIYLMWHFISLIPYASELFGSGMIPDPSMNPTWSTLTTLIPAISDLNLTDQAVDVLLKGLVGCSALFAIGLWQNLNSLILWFSWAFLFNRNNLIANPGIPFVGWLLLACVIIPNPGFVYETEDTETYPKRRFRRLFGYNKRVWERSPCGTGRVSRLVRIDQPHNVTEQPVTEQRNSDTKEQTWRMPLFIYWSAWFLMAFGYTISGIHKLQCQSWLDGSALKHVLEGVLARDNALVNTILMLMEQYPLFMKAMTWGSLALEISFLPIGIFDRVRLPIWILSTCMQLGIMATINFTDLTLGVLMIHLFTFDGRWFNLQGK